jgi:hypothetical protein
VSVAIKPPYRRSLVGADEGSGRPIWLQMSPAANN